MALEPVRLSELPEINAPEGFWIFGSQEQPDGSMVSGKYALENLLAFARQLQLERRLSFAIGSTENPQMFIDEAMTIYRVGVKDVLNLSIDIDGTPHPIDFDTEIAVEVPAKSVITLDATPLTTDTQKMFVFIYAKANEL